GVRDECHVRDERRRVVARGADVRDPGGDERRGGTRPGGCHCAPAVRDAAVVDAAGGQLPRTDRVRGACADVVTYAACESRTARHALVAPSKYSAKPTPNTCTGDASTSAVGRFTIEPW